MTHNFPYQRFGTKVKSLREKAKETLFEVSGAVEIDSDKLERIECGIDRPSEDLVLLLINHFELPEEEAFKMWKLAGYDEDKMDDLVEDMSFGHVVKQPAVMVMPMDARIVYTDMVHVAVNNHGVVMNFMQGGGPNQQPLAISRIGMSKEHAYSVLAVLKETLEQFDTPHIPKVLNQPTVQKKSKNQ